MSIATTTVKASDIQMDYMKLLVTELRNQNPLEPLDNKEMASQLAQFSQLQQLESMNSSFAEVLSIAERAFAGSLLGKKVSFITTAEDGTRAMDTGIVEELITDTDGKTVLKVDGNIVDLTEVVSVTN